MNGLSKIISIIIIGIIVVGIFVFFIKGNGQISDDKIIGTNQYFIEEMRKNAITEIGMPIEGFEPFMYLQVYPGLTNRDFNGIEALLGVYRLVGDKLEFQSTVKPGEPVHSAEHAISDDGMAKLVERLSERMGVGIIGYSSVDLIISYIKQEQVTGRADVDEIAIHFLESFPIQVRAVVYGELNDGCTGISNITKEREGNTFLITINKTRPRDAVCTMALVPFQESISLDVFGLSAGEYNVIVNGVVSTFQLKIDNVLPE